MVSESFVRWSTRRQRRTQPQLTNDFESGAFSLPHTQYFSNIVNSICLNQLRVFLTSEMISVEAEENGAMTQFLIRPKNSSAHRFSSEFHPIKSSIIGFMFHREPDSFLVAETLNFPWDLSTKDWTLKALIILRKFPRWKLRIFHFLKWPRKIYVPFFIANKQISTNNRILAESTFPEAQNIPDW